MPRSSCASRPNASPSATWTPRAALPTFDSTVRRLLDRAALAIAADSVGGAERVTEMAVEYAKARTQFGRPIGSFQAVKHRAADMLVDVESLRSAVYYAAWSAE